MIKTETYYTRDGKLPYLKRYIICRLPFLQIYIHKFLGPDEDADLHDHPYDSFKLILKGGYEEQRPEGMVWQLRGKHGIMKAEQLHRINRVLPDTWTLFIGGKRRRVWGFQTKQGWVDFKTYLGER